MTQKYSGWVAIAVISLIPVLLWLVLGPGLEEFGDYESATHSVGELAGLVAMTMFALTFVLSTRITYIEDLFGGLDKVYIAHGILGASALTLILAHPIFLVLKFVPDDMRQAAIYLLPSDYWSVNFGIIALFGMILLIVITLFVRMKYQHWKFTHEFLGLVFFFAVLHIFLVPTDATADNVFDGYYFYAAAVSAIGLGAFTYSLVLKDRLAKAAPYRIDSVNVKSSGMYELVMSPEHKPISYKAGQFIFVRFYNEKLSSEAHPFSIASKSNDSSIRIVVKSLGDYTDKMHHLKAGDKVSVEGPFGRFNFERKASKPQIWLAGGIGITPFLGMAEDLKVGAFHNPRIKLYYSVREKKDFVGLEELREVEAATDNFTVVPWVTSEKGRLQLKDIDAGTLTANEYFLCGPGPFKKSLIDNLVRQGVPKSHIHTEEFEFR
ncbi:MAG TPA: ferric reductase-like transmembrane domain-containing protein [Candidatus Bilamarchaeum sp.]|nr:ferric reductase-like transmembrane domain-containing protein [Candidatus Bilamarchaeum sp.]